MINRYHGNLESALAAYNWGPGNVDRKGLAAPKETREYIARVKGLYQDSMG
jgi:soluble lytic murein transglycosylase-like protein